MTLEMDLKLHVLFVTCDPAFRNRNFFFSIHGNDHFTPNPFHPGYMYFISDVPHSIKTARNCSSNSFAYKTEQNAVA